MEEGDAEDDAVTAIEDVDKNGDAFKPSWMKHASGLPQEHVVDEGTCQYYQYWMF